MFLDSGDHVVISNNCNEKPRALFLGQRIVIFDRKDAEKVYFEGFYGKPLGISKVKGSAVVAPLELSLIEALYLLEKGMLCVVEASTGKNIDSEELKKRVSTSSKHLLALYRVYRDLREKGFVVRSGLKYGSEFVLYEKGPGIDHAPYVVHVVSFEEYIDPLEIVRAGRLSHSVRKRFVLAAVNEASGGIDYIVFKWIKI